MAAMADDYDDDLYYSPSKAAKEKKAREEAERANAAARRAQAEATPTYTYTTPASSDSYTVRASKPLKSTSMPTTAARAPHRRPR